MTSAQFIDGNTYNFVEIILKNRWMGSKGFLVLTDN